MSGGSGIVPMTYFTMPNKIYLMKHALKSVPGLAEVGVPHRDGHGPRTPPRCMGRVWKKFQMTNFDMPNNFSSMKCVLKSVPGLPDAGVPHGDGDGPQNSGPGVRIKNGHIPR